MADPQTIDVNLADEAFHPDDTRNCGLAIILGNSAFSSCILDFRRNKFLGLHRFVRPGAVTVFSDFLSQTFDALPWLRNPFQQVKIAWDGQQSTLVPDALYDANEKQRYFHFNFPPNDQDQIFSDHLMLVDAWQLYTVPVNFSEAIRDSFPGKKVVHATSLLIESVLVNYKNRINTPHLFLHIRGNLFDLMIFDGREMSFFNTFSFRLPEDVAYYLIFVMEQLKFNPESAPLVLLGNIDHGDATWELLTRYVRHVEFARRNEAYHYSYLLNQLPPHHYFSLLNFFSCGL